MARQSDLLATLRQASGAQIAAVTVALGIGWILAWGIYHAFLHPLRHYPGPKLWAAYRIPYVYHSVRGTLPFAILKLHLQYGPTVRIAPDHLAFTAPEAWLEIYGLLPGRMQNQKDLYVYDPPMPGSEEQLLRANDAVHARLRKMYGAAFTPKALEEQSGMILRFANLLVTALKAAVAKGPVQDMAAWYNCFTFDLTGEFAFGESFGCLVNGGKYHFFLDTLFKGATLGFRAMVLEFYGFWTVLNPLLPKSTFKPRDDMVQYTEELVIRRKERGYDPKVTDVFNHLLLQKDEEGGLSHNTLLRNAILLVVAGSETTATTMTGGTYYLCKNPRVLQKLRDEIKTAFASDSEINVKAVAKLPYLQAVISETLRVFPAGPSAFTRIVSSRQGQTIAGIHVPHKTRVSIFHHAAYRYPGNFARPLEFVPERWLPNPPKNFSNDRLSAAQPFNVGPRACIGKGLAQAELRLVLAKMLWHFEFELAEPENDWYASLKAYLIWDKGSLKVRLKPVER